jgi:hypothetical protein
MFNEIAIVQKDGGDTLVPYLRSQTGEVRDKEATAD